MSHDQPKRRQVEITNALGLHLRPANKFVTLAERYQSEIRVWYKGRAFNGKSILELTSLAAERGTRLDLEADGPDAEAALMALEELIHSEFNEDENGEERQPPQAAGPGPGGGTSTEPHPGDQSDARQQLAP